MTDRLAPPVLERQPRRLSPLTPVVRAPIVLLAFVGGSWQQLLDEGSIGLTGLLFLALLAGGAVYGVASWLRTTYWIDGDELRIDTGVVVRQSRRIRIDRLQGVDIVQPLFARLFGLAELRFDVASGGDSEGRLAFLPHTEALELRDRLLARRDDLRAVGGPQPPTAWPPAQRGAGRVLGRLDPGLLLASLALSFQTLFLGGAAVAMLGVYLVTGTFALAGGVVPTALALAFALGKRLSAYYGFVLEDTPAGLHVRRGLTSLSSQTIALARIQGLVVTEPLLWRPFGWARLDVAVAGSQVGDPDGSLASSTLMPVAPREEVLHLVRHVLSGRDAAAVPTTPPPSRARWLAPLTAWTTFLGQDDQLLVSRRGFWVRRLDIVPQERAQSLRLSQNPAQRWLRLAAVHVDSPPGPVRVRGEQRDAGEARAFSHRAVELSRTARQRELRAQDSVASTPPRPDTTQ